MDDLRGDVELHPLDAQSLADHHVFAWVAGFGKTVIPIAPFRIERRGHRSVRVVHRSATGIKAVVFSANEFGEGFEVMLEPGTPDLADVAEVQSGPAWERWRIASDPLQCDWPEAFAFASLPGTTPPVFEWIGPDDSRIWLQGPLPAASLPRPERMGSPDQRVVQLTPLSNGPLVELRYEHGGKPWRMYHAIHSPGAPHELPRGLLRWLKPRLSAHALIVSAQTPEAHAALVRAAVIEIAESLTPNPQGEP